MLYGFLDALRKVVQDPEEEQDAEEQTENPDEEGMKFCCPSPEGPHIRCIQ